MRRLLLALALAALLAFPLAGGRYVVQGTSPWQAGYSLNPQMYCAVVYDEPGEQDCMVQGEVRNAEIVRVRMVGPGSVHVSIVDMRGAIGLPEQRAVIDCDASCVVPIPHPVGAGWSDKDWTMWVETSTPGRGAVEVSVETATRLDDERSV